MNNSPNNEQVYFKTDLIGKTFRGLCLNDLLGYDFFLKLLLKLSIGFLRICLCYQTRELLGVI